MDRRVVDGCRLGACASRREVLVRIPGAVLAMLVGGQAATAEAFYAVGEIAGVMVGPSQKSYPLPAADGAAIDKDAQVIVARFQGKVVAFNLACPHENTALRWKPAVKRFECTKHDSKYAPDGQFIGGRATRNMDRLHIRREDGSVVVDLTTLVKSDAQPAEWAAAVVAIE